MVNASLNWASIVGIVLAICGAGLYFMRSFKPALARDYDVFFAAIGLLCGGILFFQGWRLDPILQFGQFLLAGTTVFFAYESVRLRGVATDQARRSPYFDGPESRDGPNEGLRGGQRWDDSYDRFDQPEPIRRRFSNSEEQDEEFSERDLYKPRRVSRAAIPEEAISRRGNSRFDRNSFNQDSVQQRRASRFRKDDYETDQKSTFGQRRDYRQELRRGSRPSANEQTSVRRGSRPSANEQTSARRGDVKADPSRERSDSSNRRNGFNKNSLSGRPIEDASFSSRTARKDSNIRRNSDATSKDRFTSSNDGYKKSSTRRPPKKRDNNSRFDD